MEMGYPPPPPPERKHACENITSRRTAYAGGKNWDIIATTKVFEKKMKTENLQALNALSWHAWTIVLTDEFLQD